MLKDVNENKLEMENVIWNALIMYAIMILETVIYVLLAVLICDLVTEIVIKNATTHYVIMTMVNV